MHGAGGSPGSESTSLFSLEIAVSLWKLLHYPIASDGIVLE